MANSDPVHSVLKALDILRFISEAEHPLNAGDIAGSMGMKLTTCCNLLRTLVLRGYAVKSSSGYMLGPAPEELLHNVRRRDLLRMGGMLLRRLSEEFPDAVLTFTELTPSSVCCRLRMSPDRPGELQHPAEHFFQPYASVSAVCLQTLSENAGLFESNFPFEEYGGKWYRSPAEFRKEQQEIRKENCCFRETGSGIIAAIYAGGNCTVGFRSESSGKSVIPHLQKIIRKFTEKENADACVSASAGSAP